MHYRQISSHIITFNQIADAWCFYPYSKLLYIIINHFINIMIGVKVKYDSKFQSIIQITFYSKSFILYLIGKIRRCLLYFICEILFFMLCPHYQNHIRIDQSFFSNPLDFQSQGSIFSTAATFWPRFVKYISKEIREISS